MERDADRTEAWPPPHPSPPDPPPRGYGSPDAPPARLAPGWLLVAGAVVGVVLIAVVVALARTGGGDGAQHAEGRPRSAPVVPTATASPSGSTAAPAYRCWDGSPAQRLADCSRPDGPEGLGWLFPAMAGQRCGAPTGATGPGVVLRVLCVARLGDGTRVRLGYYQWASLRRGIAFYDDQGLKPAEAEGFHSWVGRSGGTAKSALLYDTAPFSVSVTLPASARPTPEDLQKLQPRPPAQLRGEPVG